MSGQQASFAGQRIQRLEFLLQQGNLQQLDGPQQDAVGSPSRDDRGQLPAGPNDGDGQAADVAVVVLASQIIQQLADFVVGLVVGLASGTLTSRLVLQLM